MVKLIHQQREHEYRGYSNSAKEEFLWTPPSLEQRILVCFYERTGPNAKEPDWLRLENYCKSHKALHWQQMIDNRQAIYVAVDRKCYYQARHIASRAKLSHSWEVAYPSGELTQEVQQALQQAESYTMYSFAIGAIDDRLPGIYMFFENESVVYVGQAKSLPARMNGHRHSQKKESESAGFMDYVRYRHKHPEQWGLRFLGYHQCASLAVQGQLTPDLINDQEARQLLTERYAQNTKWGLDKAEVALIACLRPHFNQSKNVYPRSLQHMEYCEHQCRLCLRADKGGVRVTKQVKSPSAACGESSRRGE